MNTFNILLTIIILLAAFLLFGCATLAYNDPKLVGYITQEECRIKNNIKPGYALPNQCKDLPEFAY